MNLLSAPHLFVEVVGSKPDQFFDDEGMKVSS